MDKANCSGIEFYVCLRKRVELSVASFDHVKDDQFMSSKIMILPTSPPILAQHSIHPADVQLYQHLNSGTSPVQSSPPVSLTRKLT